MAFNKVSTAEDRVRIRSVIVSVFDKTGLEELAVALLRWCPGLRFYSTGGSYDFLAKLLGDRAGAHLVRMSDYTGQPEMKGGLVKTLDWKIYLGLLAETGDAAHDADIENYGAVRFDMVIGNLYPFAQAAAKATGVEEARQHIDIGGPSMLRAAAKNFLRVAPVCSPELYAGLARDIEAGGGTLGLAQRASLAGEVFRRQSEYDATVGAWFGKLSDKDLSESYS